MHNPAIRQPFPAHCRASSQQAARRLHRQVAELTQQVLCEPLLRDSANPERATTVRDDLAAWIAVLTENLPDERVAALFGVRAAAHAVVGLRCDEALVQQHVCVAAVNQAMADSTGRHPTGADPATVTGPLSLHLLGIATTAIVRHYRAAHTAAAPQPPPRTAEPASSSARANSRAKAPRWCLSAVQVGEAGRIALLRFRAANPQAVIAVTGTQLTAFTHHHPQQPELFGPYGLVPVVNGDTVRAARRAALAAVVARHYGERVEGEQVLPLVAALDLAPEECEAYITSCLGPLHTTDRYTHLRETLSVLLAHNLCVSAAARALYIHRHTLTYRLRLIHDLTGLDLNHPFDRMRAELALILSRTPNASLPRPRRR